MGFLFGAGKAAKIQADAILKSANMTADQNREVARGTVLNMQSQIAMKNASDQAAEVLKRRPEKANVLLSAQEAPAEIDPTTNRRRTKRAAFFNKPSATGIQI